MLDPCTMAPTQFFIMRKMGGDAFGVIEVPKMASVPLNGFELTMLASCHMDNHYTRCEWSNGKDRGEEVEIHFSWRDWICDDRPTSDGAGILFSDHMGVAFEPVEEEEAISSALLGYLDYYRTTEIHKHGNTSALNIQCKYVGKVEPGDNCWPTIPEEPADSQILPQRRPSRLARLAREYAERERITTEGGMEPKKIEYTGGAPVYVQLGDGGEVIEAEYEEG